jgi:hypothetical protein
MINIDLKEGEQLLVFTSRGWVPTIYKGLCKDPDTGMIVFSVEHPDKDIPKYHPVLGIKTMDAVKK